MVGLPKMLYAALLLICIGRQVESDASNHRYNKGDIVPFYANIVGPYFNPRETYAYYDFPFCSPDTVIEKKLSLGEMLNGDRLVSAPYKLEFLVNKDSEVLCNNKLSKSDVSQFRSVIGKDYYIQMYYDDLPIWGFIGYAQRDYPDEGTKDKEVSVNFTYSVKWLAVQHSFDERMEKYIGSACLPHHMSIHRHTIAYLSVAIFILIICLVTFYVLVLHKDISINSHDVEEDQALNNQEEKGWKNIHGDVFRYPKHTSLFTAALGSGIHLLLVIVSILVLGLMGYFQPYVRGVFWNARHCIRTYIYSLRIYICFFLFSTRRNHMDEELIADRRIIFRASVAYIRFSEWRC